MVAYNLYALAVKKDGNYHIMIIYSASDGRNRVGWSSARGIKSSCGVDVDDPEN